MNRNGFSLLELLVVIALVVLLSSFIVPSMRKGRNKGQEVVCASNIKQISTAFFIYQQENQTFPPGFCRLPGYDGTPPTGRHGNSASDWQGWWWFDFMADSFACDASKSLWCPSRRIAKGLDTNNVLCGNYGVNTSICRIASLFTDTEFVGKPLRVTDIPSPNSTMLVMDSGYALTSWKALSPDTAVHAFEAPVRQNTYYLPGADVNRLRIIHPDHTQDALQGRHVNKTINIGYADGHIGSRKPADVAPEFDGGLPVNYSAWSKFKSR